MLSVTAYGKINWALDIIGKKQDGYHLMDMVMQTVSLGDELMFSPSETIEIIGENRCITHIEENMEIKAAPLLFDESNLIYRAAQLLRTECRISSGVKIHLIKNIPFGAGMGGGSADAAATLLALNHLWKLRFSLSELCSLGLRLGADIPFMLHGGLAHVHGIGEIVKPIPCRHEIPLVLIQNCGGVSTKTIFQFYDQFNENISHPNIEQSISNIRNADLQKLGKCSGNVLQPVVTHFSPMLEKGIEMLYSVGASFVQMTGSGSAVFGAFSSEQKAAEAASVLKAENKGIGIWLAHTINQAWNFVDN